jgi:molybdenum cofactor cytidylyltransferase
MKFGPVPVAEAVGAIAAHSLKLAELVIRKGVAITPEHVASLKAHGLDSIVAVRLDADDVGEDPAAGALARAVAGANVRVEHPFTGRSNVYATCPGILVVGRTAVDRLNAVDESVTFATLAAFKPVVAGEMIGTVKIIPYAVPKAVLADALASLGNEPAIRVAPYRIAGIGVISTLAPSLKPSVVAKTVATLEARLAPAGASVAARAECSHETEALTEALRKQADDPSLEMVVIFGASAIADRRDVIPAAIEAAGGEVEHFGMPVDPGNLLLIGRIGTKPVIGAPGCARSPKENGFDWVLQRQLAGLAITRADITQLGVGGLLMEIVSRGQPREGGESTEE